MSDVYAAAPDLRLAISGPRAARAHYAAEYAAAGVAAGRPPDVEVDVRFARSLPAATPSDGHKTVRWSVQASRPDERPLRLRITIAGRPRRFALSMVQGYLVEPLVSLAAAAKDLVLLPAAALVEPGGAVVLLGRSGAGKTSVVTRAIASGRGALGDDQVLVGTAGEVRSWPRRLRVYPDLRQTAPSAVRALPMWHRRALDTRRIVAAATAGWVAPSLALPWEAVGGAAVSGPLPITRVLVVERGGAGDAVAVTALQPSAVVDVAGAVLAEQRSRFVRVLGPDWLPAVDAAAAQEARTLAAALAGVPAERWTVPGTWGAARSVSELAAAVGISAP
ncbi:MAG: hypothetical protein LC789_00735 [Actinobacteria bacterium]|nr:hypothetical protein [Actinomycetota bacterium]MCA1721420.1 hypothetical protein [Actinomycetota bacterium]